MASGAAVTSPPSASSSKRSIRCGRRSPAGDAVALRFEDHAGFERTCLIAAAGGALAAGYATSITRLAELRLRLDPEALRLAERVASARILLLRTAPSEVRPGLRRVADRLALSALDLAGQGTEASRAELLERVVQLERACSTLAPPIGGG